MQRLRVIESPDASDMQKKFKKEHGNEINRNICKIHEITGLDGHTLKPNHQTVRTM